jgi:hypothetical protein
LTRPELDQLLSIKLDLVRAMWLLDQMAKAAIAEHTAEDARNTALEQSNKGADHDKQRSV